MPESGKEVMYVCNSFALGLLLAAKVTLTRPTLWQKRQEEFKRGNSNDSCHKPKKTRGLAELTAA